MSLFGTSPTEDDSHGPSTPSRSRAGGAGNGLFDDDNNTAPSPRHKKSTSSVGSSLFADDKDVSASNGDDSSSPWDMPTPRKQRSRAELIGKLLPAADAPESYIETFETVVREDGSGGRVSAAGVAKVFAMARLDADGQAKIMSILAPGNASDVTLGHNEFNVLLALIGLAQEGDIISLDGVDERRQNLPKPKLSGLTVEAVISPVAELAAKPPQTPSSLAKSPPRFDPTQHVQQSSILRPAMDDPEDDPWNTPDMHKGHNHAKQNGIIKAAAAAASAAVPSTATNGFSIPSSTPPTATTAPSQVSSASVAPAELPSSTARPPSSSVSGQGGWGGGFYGGGGGGVGGAAPITAAAPPSFNDVSANLPIPNPFSGDGPARAPDGNQSAPNPVRTIGGRTGSSLEENILVTLMPGKEGLFMFQHHNYEITSQRRGSKVIRRYSDFVWLLDCLQKRYPFRVLPLLPPKRVAVNGNHLSNDGSFIEKRRRGLARFLNALTRHPVLNQEQLVVMFLTVPTELSVWRKQSTISVVDEFTDRHMPPGLEDSLPGALEDLFTRTRSGIRRSAELYINVCNIMDRLVKRTEGVAADHARIAMSLTSLTEASNDTYATDTNEVPLLNDGLTAMSRHLSTCQSLLEDESRGWDQGVLEDLKRQRDSLVSLRDMFDRRERLDRDTIPHLERRIQTNETKLAALRLKPEGTLKPGEIEKVAENIIKDKESIVNQHNRSVFVKECIRDELITFQSTQYHVSRWNQDWAEERVKYAEMLADNWRRLLDALEGMPLGD